jgi:hypothetical protein
MSIRIKIICETNNMFCVERWCETSDEIAKQIDLIFRSKQFLDCISIFHRSKYVIEFMNNEIPENYQRTNREINEE